MKDNSDLQMISLNVNKVDEYVTKYNSKKDIGTMSNVTYIFVKQKHNLLFMYKYSNI